MGGNGAHGFGQFFADQPACSSSDGCCSAPSCDCAWWRASNYFVGRSAWICWIFSAAFAPYLGRGLSSGPTHISGVGIWSLCFSSLGARKSSIVADSCCSSFCRKAKLLHVGARPSSGNSRNYAFQVPWCWPIRWCRTLFDGYVPSSQDFFAHRIVLGLLPWVLLRALPFSFANHLRARS